MTTFARALTLLATVLMLASCASSQSTPQSEADVSIKSAPVESVTESSEPTVLPDVWIALEPVPGAGTVTINGKTNLPDGYVLSLSACRYHESPDGPRCWMVDDGKAFQGLDKEVKVQGGAFSVELSPIRTIDEIKAELQESWAAEQEIAEMTGIPIDEPGLAYTTDFLVDSQVTISVRGVIVDQSPEILEIIGKKGENLKGLVVEDGITGKSVAYSVKLDM